MLAANTLRIRASVYGMTEEAVGEMGDGSGERGLSRCLVPLSHRVEATSHDDAQARINRLAWAKPVGELVARVPAGVGELFPEDRFAGTKPSDSKSNDSSL